MAVKNNFQLYTRHDSDQELQLNGTKPINYSELDYYNSMGYAIYMTVNRMKNQIRDKNNIYHLDYFYVDVDKRPKIETLQIIAMSIPPSRVVETKNGFHIYYKIKGNMIEELGYGKAICVYEDIIQNSLIPYFKADKSVYDAARILRAWPYYHCKDINNPFKVDMICEEQVSYTYQEICDSFGRYTPQFRIEDILEIEREVKEIAKGDTIWDKAKELNNIVALKKISGSEYVNRDTFSFKKNSDGTQQIFVNNKITGCWINKDGTIGSKDKGGPYWTNWVKWYHPNSWTPVLKAIHEFFPELK